MGKAECVELSPDLKTKEIIVPSDRVLRHFLRTGELTPDEFRIEVIPTSIDPPPIFPGPTCLTDIAEKDSFYPLLLELRFVPSGLTLGDVKPGWEPEGLADEWVRIALLMTNERYWLDLAAMGRELYQRLQKRGIKFDAVVAPEVLGPKLSQEIVKIVWEQEEREIYLTSFQKGKPRIDKAGIVTVGPPKPWVEEEAGIAVSSGTSLPESQQMQRLFLDQDIAAHMRKLEFRVLLVDDALLTQGTINASLALLRQFKLPIAGVATVLNEGPPVDHIEEYPYVSLTKLPLFVRLAQGIQPIPGTYEGLDYFYLEK